MVKALALTGLIAVVNTACSGHHGDKGEPGAPGQRGDTGAPGASCSVSTVEPGPVAPNGGARITCPDGSDVLLVNGAPGAAGPQGQPGVSAPATPFTIVNAVTPCPNLAGANPEVILVLQNRQLLASVSNSSSLSNTRLAFIGQGTFRTTDGRGPNGAGCEFTVTANQITWAGGSASY